MGWRRQDLTRIFRNGEYEHNTESLEVANAERYSNLSSRNNKHEFTLEFLEIPYVKPYSNLLSRDSKRKPTLELLEVVNANSRSVFSKLAK